MIEEFTAGTGAFQTFLPAGDALRFAPGALAPTSYYNKNRWTLDFGLRKCNVAGFPHVCAFRAKDRKLAEKMLMHLGPQIRQHEFGRCTGFYFSDHNNYTVRKIDPSTAVFAFEREHDALWFKMLWPDDVIA